MRRRDWAGTVFVACLIGLAAYLHSHALAVVLLGATAFLSAVVVVFDVVRERHPKPVPASQLPPASIENARRAVEDMAWGQSRYRAESEWNAEEGRAYLRLHRRDGESQAFRITVEDPLMVKSKYEFAQAGKTIIVLYPDSFPLAPATLIPGNYTVTWYADVEQGGTVRIDVVDRDGFQKPS